MRLEHNYEVSVTWEGNRGTGTSNYRAYGREHSIAAAGKHGIEGSADPSFRGDAARWNPEEMLLAALSQCHMLSYLHVAASHGVVVLAYTDTAVGTMEQTRDGGGHFTSVTLRPVITIAAEPSSGDVTGADLAALAMSANTEASEKCFIAASVNFPVGHEPRVVVEPAVAAVPTTAVEAAPTGR